MLRCFSNPPMQLWLALATICVGYVNADILVFSASDSHKVEQGFRDLPSRFGGMIPAEGIKGLVVYADPPTACQDIKGPPNDSDYYADNWIVLIARLNCSFETKVRNAQKAGYDVAIVHNVNSNDLEQMSAKDSTNITIPSVFVSEFTGSLLKNVYLYNTGYFVLINDLPFSNTHLLLPFAIVVGICFLVMLTFMIVRCIKDRRRARRHRLPNSSLKKIPTHKYTKGDPYETCAICLDDYIENEKLRVLPCAHAYHTKCIDPWLTKNRRVCPVCKRKVFAADERVETDSESDSDADDSTPLIRDGSNRNNGTEGGTFRPQSDNPFWRHAQRHRQQLQQQQQQQRRRHRRHRNNGANDEDDDNDDDDYSTASSYDSADHPIDRSRRHNDEDDEDCVEEEEVEALTEEAMRAIEEGLRQPVFVTSDSHSINGEMPDLEKSVSSTKPHTVNLSVEVDEISTLDINNRTVGRQNARTGPRAGAINPLPTSIVPRTSDDSDVII